MAARGSRSEAPQLPCSLPVISSLSLTFPVRKMPGPFHGSVAIFRRLPHFTFLRWDPAESSSSFQMTPWQSLLRSVSLLSHTLLLPRPQGCLLSPAEFKRTLICLPTILLARNWETGHNWGPTCLGEHRRNIYKIQLWCWSRPNS